MGVGLRSRLGSTSGEWNDAEDNGEEKPDEVEEGVDGDKETKERGEEPGVEDGEGVDKGKVRARSLRRPGGTPEGVTRAVPGPGWLDEGAEGARAKGVKWVERTGAGRAWEGRARGLGADCLPKCCQTSVRRTSKDFAFFPSARLTPSSRARFFRVPGVPTFPYERAPRAACIGIPATYLGGHLGIGKTRGRPLIPDQAMN